MAGMKDFEIIISERFNYAASDAEITIRKDAPEVLRVGLRQLAYVAKISGKALRELICCVLLQRPDHVQKRTVQNVQRSCPFGA